jgi:PST family polysaccharide transporter
MTLRDATISGLKWSAIAQAAAQSMQIITYILLARLLPPGDFGLVSMAMVVTNFVLLFNDLGTAAAVVQRRELSPPFLSSIFWLNLGFGLVLTLVVMLLSPLIAWLYHEPRVTPLLMVMALSFALFGSGKLQQALLQRDLNFAVLAKIEVLAIGAGSAAALLAALAGAGAWSLVLQLLIMVIVRCALLWRASPWRPTLVFRWGDVRAIGGYSASLTSFNIVNYIGRNADNVLIARFLGSVSLGYYSLAYRIMLYPLQRIAAMIGQVMFPAYAQVQDDHARFGRGYLQSISAIAFITFPLMLGLTVLAEPFVLVLLGAEWQPVVVLLTILGPVGMLQSISTTVGTIYTAKGRTDLMLQVGGGMVVLVIIGFVIGLRWGIVGVASAYAIVYLLVTYPVFAVPLRLIDLSVADLARALRRPLLCSLLMMAAVLALRLLLPASMPQGAALALGVATGVLVYALASWYLNGALVRELLAILRQKL